MSSPVRDAVTIQERGQIVGMDAPQVEAHQTRPFFRTVHVHVYFRQPLERVLRQLPLVGFNGIHPRWTPNNRWRHPSKPTTPAMLGVPASNRYGMTFHSDRSKLTERIMSPPPRNGSISSKAIPPQPYSTPTPVGPLVHFVGGEGEEIYT